MNRRQALTAGAAVLGLPWLAPTSASAAPARALDTRVGRDEIDELQATATDLDALDQQFGGDRLWRVARSHLLRIHQLIDHGTYTEDVGQELHVIAGQLTTSLGWYSYDAGRAVEARMYFSEALNAAMLTGDEALATRTLSNMARQAVDLGKPREAVRFAKIAQSHADTWDSTPRVAALLAIRKAQGYARLGDEMNCKAAIRQAWKSFDRGTDEKDPQWTSFLNEAELVCLEGMCRLDLGQNKLAIRLLDRSSALQDLEHSRNRGMCLAKLSYAALQDRDVDRTVASARESVQLIKGGMTSTRNLHQLVLVRDGLSHFPRHLEAQDTVELLNQHIA
ncbi:hypothetical protein [Streptacidiphilus sp. EB103A]|uniref:hypothetical protein n=1 Tax=Streptacidiphilus sp. EB103A TaxID=3156275 RepID=UPI003516CB30